VKSKKVWSNLLRIAVSVFTLWILLKQVGGQQVFSVLRGVRLDLLFVAWIVFLIGVVIRVFRWRALLHGLDLHPSFWLLLKLYLIGGFFNTFLPSGFGGDVVRVLELSQGEHGAAATGTVIVDRMTGLLSLMAMGLVILPFAPELAPWLRWVFILVAVSGLSVGFLLLEGKVIRQLMLRLSGWFKLPPALSLEDTGALARVYQAVTGSGKRALWLALVLSTLFNVFNVLLHWLCALAVGINVNLTFHFVFVPLLALTLLLPISIGGLGARDWVAQPLMKSVAVAGPSAAAWSMSVWAVTGAAGLIGGLLYIGQAIWGLMKSSPGDTLEISGQ
jgi:uncharacterized protein (TIRG00374 family)